MKDSCSNVMFSYMYRDAGNFKQYGEVTFANPDQLPLPSAEEAISRVLIDGQFFVPTEWSIPLIYGFAFDPELDHSWSEFTELGLTDTLPTDERTLRQFLETLPPRRAV